jgi:hypothetical protein
MLRDEQHYSKGLGMSDALSNQRPLLCEDSVIICQRFLQYAKCLQIAVFFCRRISQHFGRFLRLLHNRAYI